MHTDISLHAIALMVAGQTDEAALVEQVAEMAGGEPIREVIRLIR
ncbi:hypothetical protein [Azotobacter beijerinckii]|nr:hypothetical protein [Azotobacter beijerinckii]MDV7212469.1 hypothetical protein [Azotobacter beijerinckii]